MIAFLINELDVRGGTHKQLLKLLEYTEKQGLDFCVITKKINLDKTYPGFRKYGNKVRLFRHKVRKSIILKFFSNIFSIYILRKLLNNVDIVNIHDSGFETLLPAFIGKKTYWQINDLHSCFKVGVSKGKMSLQDKILRSNIILFKSIITDFIVNVTKNKERIQTCFRRNAHVFYCGIEPVGIRRNISQSIVRFKDKRLNLLTSGVFFPYRNYETQVTVIKQLIKKGINAHLNIIGSTELNKEYANSIRKMVSNEGLAEHITICGQVNEEEFEQLHQNSDLFLFVNIDQSWGLAVFEAMSCSIPVIVSRSVGATEILTDETNAIFVDPIDSDEIADAIISLMCNEDVYIQLANTSSVFHNLYSWDNAYCSKMIDLMIYGNA